MESDDNTEWGVPGSTDMFIISLDSLKKKAENNTGVPNFKTCNECGYSMEFNPLSYTYFCESCHNIFEV